MHACMLLFLPALFFLFHDSPPKMSFLSYSACIQQAPNTDMSLISSHLNLVCLFDISYESLEIICELLCMHLILCSRLLECVKYLYYNLVVDHPYALYLSLCHVLLCVFHLHNDLYFPLLERFHLSLVILLLCLCSYELCL
jgi:hypothetical protein